MRATTDYTMSRFWSDAIKRLTPYVPGEQPKEAGITKLNTNENPYPPSPLAAAVIRDFDTDRLRLYSDPDCTALKEAIADAKTVKESAIANAKIALEEAFAPRIQSMLSAKLEEMENEGLEEEADNKVEEAKKDDSDKMEEGMPKEAPRAKNKETRKTEDERSGNDLAEGDDDKELDEILAELDNELSEEADSKDDSEDIKEDEKTDAEEEGYKDGEEDADEDMDEDEEIDLEDMSEEDLKKFIEDVIEDMVGAGELEAGESFEDDVDVDVDEDGEMEVEDDMDTAVDVELDEAKDKDKDKEKQKFNARLDDAEGGKHGKKKQDMAQRRADSENMEKALGGRKFAGDSKMKEELREAYATVKTLKSELNEINLLNAKLLYTNKIFKSKNLTESQKVKVLESFDKATTVKEAKLVFETVNSGLKSKKTRVNENLGRASKSAGMAVRKTTKQPIVESNEMVMRFQKLAGIINS